ncbi:MAG: hypothetical protein ACOC0N_12500 [Chroococcales cyanobacterium]
MSNTFRHYRYIQIVNDGNSFQPKVNGVETIYCNGKQQVYYWTDLDSLLRQELADWPFSLMSESWEEYPLFPIDELMGMDTKEVPRPPRYINPNEVVIESENIKQSSWKKRLQKVRQAFTTGTHKIQKIIKNVPSAFKVAWRELKK